MAELERLKRVATRALIVLLANVLVAAGIIKLLRVRFAVDEFNHFRLADWLRLLIGGIELISGLALLVPRTSPLDAAQRCYSKNMRVAIACCVALALLGVASGLALINCPFLVSSDHPSCCHKYAPNKCPLSNSLETCPYVPLDAKIQHREANVAGTPPQAIGLDLPVVSVRPEIARVAWTPSLTDLHIRIRVLLI